MTPNIHINPTDEELDKLLNEYKRAESTYPKALPDKKQKMLIAVLMPLVFITFLPALLLLILKLPFIIIRKIRVKYLEKIGQKRFNDNYAWDPDHACSEYCFIEPGYKSTPKDLRLQKERKELKEKTEHLKQEWLNEPANLNRLMDYASYASIENYYSGKKLALHILHQLKTLPLQPELKYEILYWNLSVLMDRFKLPNQMQHYKKRALEKGYQPPKQTINLTFLVRGTIVSEAWNALHYDIINCWPS